MKEFYIPILPITLEKNTDQKLNDREVPGIELEYPWREYKSRSLFTGVFIAAGKDGLAASFCAEVPGSKIVARRTEDKTKVYEDDCLEFFIMPGTSLGTAQKNATGATAGAASNATITKTPTGATTDAATASITPTGSVYYAWEINPNGACLDYRVFVGDGAEKLLSGAGGVKTDENPAGTARKEADGTAPNQKKHEKYDGGEKIFGINSDTIAGVPLLFDYDWKSHAVRRIEIDDDFWYLELFIPWSDLGLTEPPAPGTTWYGTANRVDAGARSRAVAGTKRSENPGLVCLIEDTELPSFHQPQKFAAFHFAS